MTAVRSLLRNCELKTKYRLITFLTHIYYDEILSKTGHEFYYWNNRKQQDPKLPNFYPINEDDLPISLAADAVLCQSYEQYPTCRKLAHFWQLPLIYISNLVSSGPVNADIFIYPSSQVAESFTNIGAILALPTDEGFSDISRGEIDDKLILTHINDPKQLDFCKQVSRCGKDIKVQTVDKDKSVRFKQYDTAKCFLQLHDNQFPYHAYEAAYAGVPVLSIKNIHSPFVSEHHYFGSLTECYAKITSLPNKKFAYNIDITKTDDYITNINNVLSFIDSFIYIR
jgi:hypothetical protein